MKINVLKDSKGDIVATFEQPSDNESTLRPEVPEGYKVEEMDMPDNYISKLDDLYKKKEK